MQLDKLQLGPAMFLCFSLAIAVIADIFALHIVTLAITVVTVESCCNVNINLCAHQLHH